MSFCPNCGASLPDGTKFCTECGQKIAAAPATPAPPAQPAYEAPAPAQPTYAPPAQQTPVPPTQPTYEAPAAAPAQPTPVPPAQPAYAPPAQQTYEAPAPAPVQQRYAPPTAPEKVMQQKKPGGGGKKTGLIIGIAAAAVVLVVVALVLLLGGKKGGNDPVLGRYDAVSCTMEGIELDAEGDWIELKKNGKADVRLLGEEFGGTWKLDGETFTFEQGGDKYPGTLKDGVLNVDLGGLLYTFQKAGTGTENGDKNDGAAKPGKTAEEVGYWTLLRVDSDNADAAMSEEDLAMFKELGINFFVEIKSDGTAALVLDNPVKMTWENGKLSAEDGTSLTYTLENDQLCIRLDGADYIFVRGEGNAPEINWNAQPDDGDDTDDGDDWDDGGDSEPGDTEDTGAYAWWDGKWYGWLVFSNASSYYSDWIGDYGDCVVEITADEDGTGYVELYWLEDEETFAETSVTFGAGITENGCMMSESGTILGLEINHADWIVDPGASMVSEFDHMIHIDSTMTDVDGDWIDYDIFLRPWGMEWEDVRTADTSNMLYDDMMPLNYDDWYLPQIQGKSPTKVTTSGDGYPGFDGPTDILDYCDDGEIFFEYPTDYTFDNSFGIEALENSDGSVRITFLAEYDEYFAAALKDYLDLCSEYDEFKKEELTIAGFDAEKVTYVDEWGDAYESVYVDLSSNGGKYLAIRIDVSAYTKADRDADVVQNIIYSMQVN